MSARNTENTADPFWEKENALGLRIVSVSIVVFITCVVSYSTSLAIHTGVREGAREPQTQYVKEKIEYLQEAYAELQRSKEPLVYYSPPVSLGALSKAAAP